MQVSSCLQDQRQGSLTKLTNCLARLHLSFCYTVHGAGDIKINAAGQTWRPGSISMLVGWGNG